jgi:hypothetical protein
MKQVGEIAALIVGVAMVGVIVKNAGGVSKIITAGGNAFTGALSTATFQGNSFYGPTL